MPSPAAVPDADADSDCLPSPLPYVVSLAAAVPDADILAAANVGATLRRRHCGRQPLNSAADPDASTHAAREEP